MVDLVRPEFRQAGDSALLVSFPDCDQDEASRRVRGALALLDEARPQGLVDLIPVRTSLLIVYDPLVTSPDVLEEALWSLDASREESPSRMIEIPTLYGGEWGPDLAFLADRAGLSEEEVVALHSSREYTVYFIGFMPGFPYLGPLPEQFRAPRLDTPRPHVPAGSVAVAEDLTGIYPVASPGGWRLIGQTPYQLFDPLASPPSLLRPGDRVRFVPIDEATFARLQFEMLSAHAGSRRA